MRLITLDELKKIKFDSLDKDSKEEVIANYVYHTLMCNISLQEVRNLPETIALSVSCIIEDDKESEYYFRTDKYLKTLLIDNAINNANAFSISEFLNRPDRSYQFRYPCKYNTERAKAALGFITTSEALYCDVPVLNHAAVLTAYIRRDIPDYSDLNNWARQHHEMPDWHDEVLVFMNAIIIHFMPSRLTQMIYIPYELSSFQYNELTKLNEMLLLSKVKTVTNYNNLDLDSALKSRDFKSDHGCSNLTF